MCETSQGTLTTCLRQIRESLVVPVVVQIQFEKQTDENYVEYNNSYNKLTEPTEFHTINIGGFQFIAYFNSISDEVYYYDPDTEKAYFSNLVVNFTAKAPARTPA